MGSDAHRLGDTEDGTKDVVDGRRWRERVCADECMQLSEQRADSSDLARRPSNVVIYTPWVDGLGTTEYESKEQRSEVSRFASGVWDLTCAARLHDEIVAFFKYAAPTPDERHARAMVIAEVSQVVKRRLPKASVDTFGSVAQDLYLPDG